ncbi:MAG: hypothetical protein V4450_17545 [Bacteroidota bacterium]
MKNKFVNLDYLKRLAKKIKKEKCVNHAQALDLVAQAEGYANWKHCLRSNADQAVTTEPTVIAKFHIGFNEWLSKHKNRNSPLGDLSSDMLKDSSWPSLDSLNGHRNYLSEKHWFHAILAMERAWRSYRTYLRTKNSPAKPRKVTPAVKKGDERKITFIKNVKALHFRDRQVEVFSTGDKAWISLDSSKAIPVTVMKANDHNYFVRVERPRSKAGNILSFFLDEVRSTPELACINRITS